MWVYWQACYHEHRIHIIWRLPLVSSLGARFKENRSDCVSHMDMHAWISHTMLPCKDPWSKHLSFAESILTPEQTLKPWDVAAQQFIKISWFLCNLPCRNLKPPYFPSCDDVCICFVIQNNAHIAYHVHVWWSSVELISVITCSEILFMTRNPSILPIKLYTNHQGPPKRTTSCLSTAWMEMFFSSRIEIWQERQWFRRPLAFLLCIQITCPIVEKA